MAEWVYAQTDPAEELAQLSYFSFKKRQPEGEIEFVDHCERVCVQERGANAVYAQADRQVNQRSRAVPSLWRGGLAPHRTYRMRAHF